MTTMTNFSATAERIGKTTSEKKAVEADDMQLAAEYLAFTLCHVR